MFYPSWQRNDYEWLLLYVNVAPPSSSLSIIKLVGYYLYNKKQTPLFKTEK